MPSASGDLEEIAVFERQNLLEQSRKFNQSSNRNSNSNNKSYGASRILDPRIPVRLAEMAKGFWLMDVL